MESNLLLARVNDTLDSVFHTDKPKFFGFLSHEEAVFVEKYLDNRNVNYCLYGGFDDAIRVMLCCFPDWMDCPLFPITALTVEFRKSDVLKHRDFLGSILGLGLKRESVGDILCEEGRAVVFVCDEISNYVIENLTKVGRVGVKVTKGFSHPLPQIDSTVNKSITVASMRLDCVVSACANCSRNTACEMIDQGLVSVNSVVCEKMTKILDTGDVLNVRRKGKFQIVSAEKRTKKGRIVLEYKTY